MLLAIAIQPNSLVNHLRSCSSAQKGLRIAGQIVAGNSKVLAVKRSSEQEVTSVVCINCLLDPSVLHETWEARIIGKGKTFNQKLPEEEITIQRLILSQL